jgi:hypothetical protein
LVFNDQNSRPVHCIVSGRKGQSIVAVFNFCALARQGYFEGTAALLTVVACLDRSTVCFYKTPYQRQAQSQAAVSTRARTISLTEAVKYKR